MSKGALKAGLGVRTLSGDTVTLADRALHHYTASLSTIETSAANASKLVSQFKKYFDDNISGGDFEYKTYVLTSSDQNKIESVKKLLDGCKISYGSVSNTNFSGYNYFSNKTEAYKNEGYQLAVSPMQPKGRLVKVLFEQQSRLVDSSTYDITAWSIPYSYGLNAWAVKEKLPRRAISSATAISDIQSSYGVLIPYTSFNASKLLAYLLNNKVRVRYATNSFTYNEKRFERGTLIILKGNNVPNWTSVVNTGCRLYNIQPYAVQTGFMETGADFGSDYVHIVKPPRVAVLTGNDVSASAAGEVWCFLR
jgi:hypothetical protein